MTRETKTQTNGASKASRDHEITLGRARASMFDVQEQTDVMMKTDADDITHVNGRCLEIADCSTASSANPINAINKESPCGWLAEWIGESSAWTRVLISDGGRRRRETTDDTSSWTSPRRRCRSADHVVYAHGSSSVHIRIRRHRRSRWPAGRFGPWT